MRLLYPVVCLSCVAAFAGAPPALAQTATTTFTSSSAIAIPAQGPANPYPSPLTVSGLTGVPYHLSVSLTITHEFPGDLDILLVSPGGVSVILMSDVTELLPPGGQFNQTRIDLDDCAPRSLRTGVITAGRYRPTNWNSAATPLASDDAFPAGAPDNVHSVALSDFNHADANGTWTLFVVDDHPGTAGTIDSWSIKFHTQPSTNAISARANPVPCAGPDYDGDGRTDVAIFRPNSGEWFIAQSGANNAVLPLVWGAPSSTGADDTQAPADYDGDGITDLAVYRQATGEWFIRRSSDLVMIQIHFGAPGSLALGDTPVPGDYDGDGLADLAIYRANTGEWFLRSSAGQAGQAFSFGYPPFGDRPARR